MKRHFSKGTYSDGLKYMERCLTSLVTRERKIKPQQDTTPHPLDYHEKFLKQKTLRVKKGIWRN